MFGENFIKTLTNGLLTKIKTSHSDWNVHSSSSEGYIKNRPFYSIDKNVNEPLDLVWDGNTEGKISVMDQAFKVSDIILTNNEIKTATIYSNDGYEMKISDIWDWIVYDGYVTNDLVFADSVVFVRKAGATLFGMPFPEPGIYFFTNGRQYTSRLTTSKPIEYVKTTIKKIDEKFLPDNVAYTDTVSTSIKVKFWDLIYDSSFAQSQFKIIHDAIIKGSTIFMTDGDVDFIVYRTLAFSDSVHLNFDDSDEEWGMSIYSDGYVEYDRISKISPYEKTDDMTKSVGMDDSGRLWTTPELPTVTTENNGQVAKVVDGKWETTNIANGETWDVVSGLSGCVAGDLVYLVDNGPKQIGDYTEINNYISHSSISAMTISPDGKLLVTISTSSEKPVVVFELDNNTLRFKQYLYSDADNTVPLSGSTGGECITFSPDGKLLLVGSNFSDGAIKVYSVTESGINFLYNLAGDAAGNALTGSRPTIMTFSHDGTMLAVGGYFSGYGKFYNVEGTTITFISNIYGSTSNAALSSYVYSIAFSANDDILVVGGKFSGKAAYYTISNKTLTYVRNLSRYTSGSSTAIPSDVYSVSFSADGKFLLAASSSILYIYSANINSIYKLLKSYYISINKANSIYFSNSGSSIYLLNDKYSANVTIEYGTVASDGSLQYVYGVVDGEFGNGSDEWGLSTVEGAFDTANNRFIICGKDEASKLKFISVDLGIDDNGSAVPVTVTGYNAANGMDSINTLNYKMGIVNKNITSDVGEVFAFDALFKTPNLSATDDGNGNVTIG